MVGGGVCGDVGGDAQSVSDTTWRRHGILVDCRDASRGGTIRHFGFAAMRVVGGGGGGFSELINFVRSPRPNAARIRVYICNTRVVINICLGSPTDGQRAAAGYTPTILYFTELKPHAALQQSKNTQTYFFFPPVLCLIIHSCTPHRLQ